MKFKIFLISALYALSTQVYATKLTVDYVANAGVKLTVDDKVVLIDALFGPHQQFKSLTAQEFDLLTHQRADVALATHKHSDHFGAKRTSSFLKYNAKALFVGTPESVDQIKELPNLKQIKTFNFSKYQSAQINHRDISITVLDFPHMSPGKGQATNFAYIVQMGDWKVLHVGDADVNREVINAHNLAQYQLDLVLIHDLFPQQHDNYQELIKLMNTKKVAFVHMVDEKAQPFSTWLKQHYPQGDLLVTGYEQLVMTKPEQAQ